jgi:hypothetical protein
MNQAAMSLTDEMNLGAIEIIIRGILGCGTVTEMNLAHLKIARERLSLVIASIDDSLKEGEPNEPNNC